MKSLMSPPPPREEAVQAAVRASVAAFRRAEAARSLSRLEFLRQQSHFLHKRWWVLQGGVLVLLWQCLRAAEGSYEMARAMGTLAPLFVVLVLPELWKNRAAGALEVECTTRHSLRAVYAARMVLFAAADLVLLTLFFSAALLAGKAAFRDLVIHFLLPFLVTACICLWTLSCRGEYAPYAALPLSLLWTAAWVLIVLNQSLYTYVALPVWLGLLVLAAACFAWSVGRLQTNCETLWEGVSPWHLSSTV